MDLRTSPPADESGHAIVDFLDEHRLPHSPENYGFAHTYFEGADEAHFMAVANLIDGGYRLRQEDVRAISAPADLHGTATTIGELSTEVMHIIGVGTQAGPRYTLRFCRAFDGAQLAKRAERGGWWGRIRPEIIASEIDMLPTER